MLLSLYVATRSHGGLWSCLTARRSSIHMSSQHYVCVCVSPELGYLVIVNDQ